MITQKLDLNLIPGRVLPLVNVSQYDKDSRTLEFTIYNGDQTFDLTGLSAYIQGLKPDGHGFNYSATVSSGKITADVTEQMTAVSGRVMCEIVIMSGTDRIGTGNFILNVEAAAMPDGSNMSDSEYSYIEELIEDAQEAATDAEAWAVGERGGVPVDPTDPTYENSAHYWALQAAGSVNDMVGATASTPGVHGLVPAPAAGDQDKVLYGDGTWKTPSGGSDMTGATAGSAGTHGLVPAPAAGDQNKFLAGDGTWKDAPAGGHTIQNPSGTDMTQRAKLQFAGTGVSVTDDSANNKTVVQFTGGGGGLLPHIVITSEVGATVTLVNGGTTISTTETSSGIFEADIPSFGTWTINVLDGGYTYTQTIVIDTVKIYTATVTAFSATIMVTYPSGATCTCTGNGESYTASGTPYTFTVHSTGTFTITVTLDGVSKTDTMVITEDGQASAVTIKFGTINLTLANEFVGLSITCVNGGTSISKTASSTSLVFRPPTTGTWTMSGTVNGVTYSTDATISDLDTAVSASLQTVPDGSTVLPTDDIQTWLACAGITDKAYTTIGEVLADSTTLLALISDNNAVDYLVRSTTWASSVCANSTAMTDIGANNYAADTLLADSDWLDAICNSTYFESVLNVKIPTMTSNTTPSGIASAYSEESANYAAWKAFDNSDTDYWLGNGSSSASDAWIMYEFTAPTDIYLISLKAINANGGRVTFSYYMEVYINGEWVSVTNGSFGASIDTIKQITSQKSTSKIRLRGTSGKDSYDNRYYWEGVKTLQAYGREDV